MERYRSCVAFSVVLVSSSALLAQQRTTETVPFTARLMSERAAERLADDLALSEPQRALWADMLKAYHDRFAEADAERRDADEKWNVQFWLELVPELDDAVDISDRSDQEQAGIVELRRRWKDGEAPYEKLKAGDSMRRGEHMMESEEAMFQLERGLREDMLEYVRESLADVQIEKWPVAMRRLTVNLEDGAPDARTSNSDPAWEVDLLSMLRQATETDAELNRLVEPIRFPDIVLMNEHADEGKRKLAERILGFEQEYAIALKDCTFKSFQYAHESVRRRVEGAMEVADKSWDKIADLKRRVWNVRLRFVDDLGALAGDLLGDAEREAWERRWRERFCPTLYLDESTDVVYEFTSQIDELDEDVRAALAGIHSTHVAWREPFKARMGRMAIDYSLLSAKEQRGSQRADILAEAYETRLERARQVNRSLRALVPPQHRERFDQLLSQHPRSHVFMAGQFVQVRP